MATNSQLLRVIGRAPKPSIYKEFNIDVLTGTYAVGDVVSSGLIVLNCVGLTLGGIVTLRDAYLYEKRDTADTFTAIKAQLRFSRDMTFTPASQNAPYTPPSTYTRDNGKVTIETTDWEDYNEATGDKHAMAHVTVPDGMSMPVDPDSLSLGLVVTTDTAVTYTANQTLAGVLVFEPH